ncbi:MAG: SRPBCC family protein [Alphaproteobacteria bacterium]|nr:SRPBCC family protein [Alphaproteobacteria bacterium]
MRAFLIAAALLAASPALAQTPQPADWTTITLTANLNRNADAAWDRIGGNDWCAIAKYLDVKGCAIDSGKGELGSVRTIDTGTAKVVEIAVARTAHSYTYAQPFTPIFYHGTLAVEAVDRTHSKLVYTLIWNQTAVGDAAAQAAAREGRTKRFQAAVDKMATAANGP